MIDIYLTVDVCKRNQVISRLKSGSVAPEVSAGVLDSVPRLCNDDILVIQVFSN